MPSKTLFRQLDLDLGDQRDGIAMSCRVRLARNISNRNFPDWAKEDERSDVADLVGGILRKLDGFELKTILDHETPGHEHELLYEQHLISRELIERGRGGALALGGDPGVSIMLNEEDHIRIQVIRAGMDIRAAWRDANRIDDSLEESLEYAFSPRLGYLTACPSNAGTGLRASVMVHLPGLHLSEDIDQVMRALEALRLAVRGVYGEGTEAAGYIYQISNQGTLGFTEEEMLDTLDMQINELIRQEKDARQRLLENQPRVLHDCVSRSLAVLQNSRLLNSEDALRYLSPLRMGVQMNLIENITLEKIDRLILKAQPAHLQRELNIYTNDPEQRDMLRSDWIRQTLETVRFVE